MPRNAYRCAAIASRSAKTPPHGAFAISSAFCAEIVPRISRAHVANGKFSGSVRLLEKSAKYFGASGFIAEGAASRSRTGPRSSAAAKKPFFGTAYR